MKKILSAIFAIILFICGTVSAKENSPDWIKNLDAAKNANQIFIVAGIGQTTAWISMHEKNSAGNWEQIMSTPGFIGKNSLEKIREGDGKTPVGIFHFNKAFGIEKNPGCAFDYVQVDENLYWSGDTNYKYNQLVDIRDYKNLNKADSEHLIEINPQYKYALNISYNEEGIAGKGSAIFLHCFGTVKPYTGGCVSIPEDKMLFVMKNVKKDCVVVIDYLKNLSPETFAEWKL